jgi:succinoglycan biosynthesis transport protein ExoP
MEIKDLILLMWRNVRYIILGLVLGMSIGTVVSKIQPPVYEATTKVFASRMRQQSNSEYLSLNDDQLLAINLQMAKSQLVLNEVAAQLGSKVNTDNIVVERIPDTLIIQIKVQDNDPKRVALIANLLAQTLIQQNEILLSRRYMAFENSINEQIDQVQKQIDDLQIQISQINDSGIQEQLAQVNGQIEQLQTEISSLEQEIAGFPSSLTPIQLILLTEKRAQLDQLHSLMSVYQQIQANLTYIGKPAPSGSSLENPRLITLRSTLDLYKQMNATLVNNLENIHLAGTQSKQYIMQIVSATPPKNPVRPISTLYVLLGGSVGLILAAIVILMIDYFDASLKTTGQTEELLGIPVLGSVFGVKHGESGLVASGDPFSAEVEAFRALGANLEIICMEKSLRTLMIMNAEPVYGKTTIAANLAVINARQGKQVILLDGDLKHPHLHSLFDIENQNGFAELLNNKLDISSASHVVKDMKGMTLMPGGIVEKDATKWLDAKKWEKLILELQNQVDLVIVDGPSADVADAQILASKTDAVLLVIQAGHTSIETAQATLRRVRLIGTQVVGVVLNQGA